MNKWPTGQLNCTPSLDSLPSRLLPRPITFHLLPGPVSAVTPHRWIQPDFYHWDTDYFNQGCLPSSSLTLLLPGPAPNTSRFLPESLDHISHNQWMMLLSCGPHPLISASAPLLDPAFKYRGISLLCCSPHMLTSEWITHLESELLAPPGIYFPKAHTTPYHLPPHHPPCG